MVGSDHDLDYPPYLVQGKPPPRLIEIAPGRFRLAREQPPPARSRLPFPNVISDEMDPTEQVDGRFYTSKAKFRAVGRALGLTEVGTSRFEPKKRYSASRENKAKRMAALQKAIAQYKSGRRPMNRKEGHE